ncbi:MULTISPECIES: hypothetical protein [unclassified Microcoleus]
MSKNSNSASISPGRSAVMAKGDRTFGGKLGENPALSADCNGTIVGWLD